MPSWNIILDTFNKVKPENRATFIKEQIINYSQKISELRNNRNIIFYGSAFLQKPMVPGQSIQINLEDINGFMTVMHGMDWDKGLTLILHTPGGVTNATETIVSYLRSKFEYIEVIVPTYAMSAGTMISLASDKILMGRQSQLGPIDPQMPFNNRMISAGAILDQFNKAKADILKDTKSAHLWAPVLPSLGPSLLQEAEEAIIYSGSIVEEWLEKYMFKGNEDAKHSAKKVSVHFMNRLKNHVKKSHGRRIGRQEAKNVGVNIEYLEDDQNLQENVLSLYHLFTILFETSPVSKIIFGNEKQWVKNIPSRNINPVQLAQQIIRK